MRRTVRYIFSLVFIFLVLELCARTDDWLKWNAPFWSSYSHSMLVVQDEMGTHGRPNARFEKWRLNSVGFRGPEVTIDKPPGIIRVAVAGASETFGLYESEDKEFPAQMQAILDQVSPHRYQILNVAAAGMTPPRIRHYFDVWLMHFRPDILVFYPTPSFYLDGEPISNKFARPSKAEHAPWFSLRLLNKIFAAAKNFVPGSIQAHVKVYAIRAEVGKHPINWVWTAVPEERVELFREHLKDLITDVHSKGVKVIVLTHANRFAKALTNEDRQNLVSWRRFSSSIRGVPHRDGGDSK